MVQDIQGQVVGKIAPQVADHIKSVIEKALYGYDLGDQSVDGFSVNVTYMVGAGGEGASIDINVESGKITGTQVLDVRDYNRMGSNVVGHQREYIDKRVFRLPDGEYITSETIPDEILEQIINEAFESDY